MHSFDDLAEILLLSNDSFLGTGATEEEIRNAENALGIPFHGGFRKFLMRFGWGGVVGVELYGLGKNVPFHLNLVTLTLSERTEMHPRLRKELLPIFNDGAGNHYCLDTSISGEPPIVFWDHEAGADQIPEVDDMNFSAWLIAYLEDIRECKTKEDHDV